MPARPTAAELPGIDGGLPTPALPTKEHGILTVTASSPVASGPAGALFEGQVGAYYLLSLLVGGEPRGLAGYTIERIELQRAAEGHPLDDIVIHALDHQSHAGILEIQVKRTISFTPTDTVFKGVVAQIADAYRKPGFLERRHELAIATARTSRKIDGAYQDVLTWARQLGSAAEFMNRIARPGSANDDMRIFVSTFRSNLREAGVADDDGTVWALLRRLQILVFDLTAQGSATAELARERAGRALHPDDLRDAGKLWTSLIALALEIAASGGARDRAALLEDLTRLSFRFAGPQSHAAVRAAIAEDSRAALADIGDRVGTVALTRYERIAAVHAALDTGRYVEIRGDAGVGKSAILKHFADQTASESRMLFLSPGRITPRGWTSMRGVLGFSGTARDLLADLASDGGGLLCIDNLDLYTDEERRTVVDLVREAATVPALAILVTARLVVGLEERNWLPADALESLGCAEPVNIGELSETEVEEVRHAAPNLAVCWRRSTRRGMSRATSIAYRALL
jgi:hypothetical protein